MKDGGGAVTVGDGCGTHDDKENKPKRVSHEMALATKTCLYGNTFAN
jgi:hypothetical protein